MPRVYPLDEAFVNPEVKIAFNQHKSVFQGRITNMKATLGHSYQSFQAYMQWYPLYEDVKKLLGTRLASLFAWSISEASNCPLCSTYFRKIIIESGEDPQQLAFTDHEQQVIDFGAAIAKNRGFVTDDLFAPIRKKFLDREIVLLTAFAGLMIATNIFNNVIQTEIDEYLHPFLGEDVIREHSYKQS